MQDTVIRWRGTIRDQLDRIAETYPPRSEVDLDALADNLLAVIEAQRERASTLVELAEISAFYYRDFKMIDEKAAKKAFKAGAEEALEAVRDKLGLTKRAPRG